MNVQSQRLVVPADVKNKLQWLLATDGPMLLKVVVDSKVPVLFMVETRKDLHEFLVYDKNMSSFYVRLAFHFSRIHIV